MFPSFFFDFKKHEIKSLQSCLLKHSWSFDDKWWLEFLIMNILMNNWCPPCRQLSPGRRLVWRMVWVWGPRDNLHHLELFWGKHPAQGSLREKDQTLQLPIHLSKSQWRWEMIKNAAVIRICWHCKRYAQCFMVNICNSIQRNVLQIKFD